MRQRCNNDTFEKVLTGFITLDKTYSKSLAVGYQWKLKEFDYANWEYTGREALLEVEKFLPFNTSHPTLSTRQIQWLNESIRVFRFKVVSFTP